MIEAERRIREALADEALHDEGASVSDTLYAAHVFEEACSPENIAALLADRDEREAKLRAEVEHLRDLLRVEQALALRQDPFRCYDIECEWFGRPVHAGDCQCHHLQATTHRANVRDALAEKENNDAAR